MFAQHSMRVPNNRDGVFCRSYQGALTVQQYRKFRGSWQNRFAGHLFQSSLGFVIGEPIALFGNSWMEFQIENEGEQK
jgi:hypothetical protein